MSQFPYPLTGVENAAIHAAEELGRLESLVLDLRAQNAQLREQRDVLSEQLAQIKPMKDLADALDRLNNFLTGQAMEVSNLRHDVDNILANTPV